MSVFLFINKPLAEAEERHGKTFMNAVKTAGVKKLNALYDKVYPPKYLYEDPYTHLGVLWTWELSWHEHIRPLLTMSMSDGVLELNHLKDLVEHLDLWFPKPDAKKLAAWGILENGEPLGKARMKLWDKYYGEKRKEFKKFIERAIHLESSVDVCLNF